MKKLAIIFMMLFAINSYSQKQFGDYENINLRESITSNSYEIMTKHPDSVGQWLYRNGADPESFLDLVNLRYLQNNYMSSGVVNDSINVKLERELPIFYTTLDDPPLTVSDTVSLVVTQFYLDSIINSADIKKYVYPITLGSGTNITDRLTSSTAPDGWILTAASNNIDLEIEHNLGRRMVNVTVWANISGNYQLLVNSAGFTSLTTSDDNNATIKSLATEVTTPLKVYIFFE